uniref:hypothetical protein n=1 Tax=Streptomyces sp. NBC_01175 TaxID=2903759 RepID=UPI002F91BAF1
MKPIPDEADDTIKAFVTGLRELVQDAVQDKPVGDLAQYGPLARSTFMHALSGQRMPTSQTVDGIIDSIAHYRGLTVAEHRELRAKWRAQLDAVTHLERGESYLYISGGGKTQSAIYGLMHGDQHVTSMINGVSGTLDADTAQALADRAEAERNAGDEPTTAPGVAAAAAALERALDRLEEASRGVAQARRTLRQAQADQADQEGQGSELGRLATKVMIRLRGKASGLEDLSDELSVSRQTIYRTVQRELIPAGLVEMTSFSPRRYALTEKGRHAARPSVRNRARQGREAESPR